MTHKTQQQSNTISCAETIKQLQRIKRIDTFFCCCCLFNATTAREEVLPALSRDCIQLTNKQLNGRELQKGGYFKACAALCLIDRHYYGLVFVVTLSLFPNVVFSLNWGNINNVL